MTKKIGKFASLVRTFECAVTMHDQRAVAVINVGGIEIRGADTSGIEVRGIKI